jgi:AcrR family transcriptional regulator
MTSPPDAPPPARLRGSEAVRAALIDAAASLLGEFGPRRLSVREIADRAGVNHGQVHHYFGGKRPLLEAAIRHLARGHYDHSRTLMTGSLFPPALSLAEDSGYWRAISQIVIDGDLDLARLEIDENVSIPREILQKLHRAHPDETNDIELKARFAAMSALQLGWVAFEDYIMMIADVADSDRDEVVTEVKKAIERLIDLAFGEAARWGDDVEGQK